MNSEVSLFHMNFLNPSHPGSSSGFWANWNCWGGAGPSAAAALSFVLDMAAASEEESVVGLASVTLEGSTRAAGTRGADSHTRRS